MNLNYDKRLVVELKIERDWCLAEKGSGFMFKERTDTKLDLWKTNDIQISYCTERTE